MFRSRLFVVLSLVLSLGTLALSCGEQTETPAPTPTKRPVATLAARAALQDMRFVIEYDGQVVATEELFTQQLDQGLLVTSEIRRVGFANTLERRALLLSSTLDPIGYDLEIGTAKAHSTWVALRDDDALSVLNNNLAWFGPVLIDQIRPLPQLMLEGTPSALPFAIQALRLTGITNTDTSAGIQYRYLDVLHELPVSLPITFTQSAGLKGIVIGTTAYQVTTEEGAFCTLWLRPADRSLFSVEFDNFIYNHWLLRTDPELNGVHHVVIRRVSTLPDLAQTRVPDDLRRIPLEFEGTDGGLRKGVLVLPDGEGPFPCLVLQRSAGITSRWELGNVAAMNGWAVFSYDKRGLGESEGVYDRGGLLTMATDALSTAIMLRQRSDLIPGKIVFIGAGEGGVVGAIASAQSGGYDGYILVSSPFDRPVPGVAATVIENALSRLNGWEQTEILSYTTHSIVRWQELLFQDQTEIVLAGRRANLTGLKELTNLLPGDYLARSTAPVLVVVGENDTWVSIDQTQALVSQLDLAGGTAIELAIVSGWDGLSTDPAVNLLDESADKVIWDWLSKIFQ